MVEELGHFLKKKQGMAVFTGIEMTQSGFSADVYLDDFYGVEHLALADSAFVALHSLFNSLG